MDAATFRKLGHELIDWVADYRERLERLPVMSPAQPGEIRGHFPKQPPRTGGGLPEALARLDEDVLPGITHWNHPSFFAYFPSNTSYASVLADVVASGLGVQGMSWQTSPAAETHDFYLFHFYTSCFVKGQKPYLIYREIYNQVKH